MDFTDKGILVSDRLLARLLGKTVPLVPAITPKREGPRLRGRAALARGLEICCNKMRKALLSRAWASPLILDSHTLGTLRPGRHKAACPAGLACYLWPRRQGREHVERDLRQSFRRAGLHHAVRCGRLCRAARRCRRGLRVRVSKAGLHHARECRRGERERQRQRGNSVPITFHHNFFPFGV